MSTTLKSTPSVAGLCLLAAAVLLWGLLTAGSAHGAQGGRAILVLDVSNSMWGRLEGREKIVVAREVLAEMLDEWDRDIDLGVIAYGHRRKADCGDIEVVVPVGPADPASISRTINTLKPRGKTPLTASVALAAKELGYTENKATVVLISDGKETCDMDPCAVGRELESQGVDFTTHVIGFDIDEEERDGLRCLADATGGRYFDAKRTEELRVALREVAGSMQIAEVDPDVVLVSLTEDGPAFMSSGLSWRATRPDGGAITGTGGSLTLPREPGRYEVSVSLGGIERSRQVEVQAGRFQRHVIALNAGRLTVQATAVSVLGPIEDPEVAWSITDDDGRALVEPFSAPGRGLYAASGSYAVTATFDGKTQQRTVRLLPGDERTETFRFELEIAKLSAPPAAPMSKPLTVTWTGPADAGDYVALVEPGSGDSNEIEKSPVTKGRPVEILMPDRPGTFELRYVSVPYGAVLTRRTVEVTEVPTTLAAPAETTPGESVDVRWSGPGGPGDRLVVASADGGRTYATTPVEAGSPAALRMPDLPGGYQIRYVSGRSGVVLASRSIAVAEMAAALDAPDTVDAGNEMEVAWTGPGHAGDIITLVAPGAPPSERGAAPSGVSGNPVVLATPRQAGRYELRYISGRSARVLASRAIQIRDVNAVLSAPESVEPGQAIEVAWQGPGREGDVIALLPRDAAEAERGQGASALDANPVALVAPPDPGSYEVRYISASLERVLARRALSVREPRAELKAGGTAEPGQTIEIGWEGPGRSGDVITVVPGGAPDEQRGVAAGVSASGPVQLELPREPGDYELRYISGASGRVLSRRSLAIRDALVELRLPDNAEPGQTIEIGWVGPGREGDVITLVRSGLDDDAEGETAGVATGNPVRLAVPRSPGRYQVRYLSGSPRRVLGRQGIEIVDVSAELEAPAAGTAGDSVQIRWRGPGHRDDSISVVRKDRADSDRGASVSTRSGNPVTLVLPEQAGAFELRYISGRSARVLARRDIEIRERVADVEPETAPAEAPAVAAAAAPREATGGDEPAQPAQPAETETVAMAAPVQPQPAPRVRPPATTLKTLKFAIAKRELRIDWTGPGAPEDRVVIAGKAAPDGEYIHFAALTGEPVALRMPEEPGRYELRYLSGDPAKVEARVPVRVVTAEDYEKRLGQEAPSLITLDAVRAATGDAIDEDLIWTVYGTDKYNRTPLTSQDARAQFWLPMGFYEVELSYAGVPHVLELIVNPGEAQKHTFTVAAPN